MLNELKQFIEEHLSLSSQENPEQQLKLATVALFMEMVIIDDHEDPKERELVFSLVKKNFALADDAATTLITEAEQLRKQATDYFQFTSQINKQYTLEQKIQLIEALWRIAFGDGVIDPHEEYLVRKIANLIYVPHNDFILAKNRINPANNH